MSAPAQIVSLERLESKTTTLANLINFILPRKPYAAAVRAAELGVAANVGWPLVRSGIGPTWEGMLHRRMALETRQPLPWVHDQAQVELLMLRSRRARNWEFWDSRIHLDRPDMQVRLTDFFARKVGAPGTLGSDAAKVEVDVKDVGGACRFEAGDDGNAVVIAQVFVSLPFLIVTLESALRARERGLDEMASSLGASPSRVFWQITLPTVLPGLGRGAALALARCLGEFGATIMFAGNIPGRTQTMSTAIYAAVQANDYDLAFRWAVIISLFSLFFIGAMNLYLKREVHE